MATIEKIIKEFKKLERGKLSKEVSGYVPYEQAERFLIHYLTQIHTQAKEEERERIRKWVINDSHYADCEFCDKHTVGLECLLQFLSNNNK